MNHAAFDSYIQHTIDSWHCPGVAIAVLQGDEVIYQRAFGQRDAEAQLPMTEDTRFALASITKSFTAMSAALLVDEGKLDWDKPVCETIPEFILHDPYITRHITVRDMLSHRTGLPRHDFAAWRLDLSRAEFIKRMRHLTFSAGFREKFQYNNLMYAATAYLVERLSGQKWEDFVHERIFTPLGMEASNFNPEPRTPNHAFAQGYRVDLDDDGKYKSLVTMPFGKHTELSPGPAGALFSTLADVTQWLRVHLNGGMLGDFSLISGENLREMHRPQTVIPVDAYSQSIFGVSMLAYGMGWMMRPYAEGTLVSHGGNVEGHSLVVGFVPESKIGVAVLTNAAASHVPIILLREAVDRALGLPEKDWNTRLHKACDPVLSAVGKGKQTSAADKRPDAPHAHPLAHYTGSYATDGYPDFAVRLENGQLQARTLGSLEWSELRHYHYEVFEWHLANWDTWVKLRFMINNAGEVTSVSIPIEPAVTDLVFTRKPLELDAETLHSLVGEYDPKVEGLRFLVWLRQGKLYWQEPGQPMVEAEPVHADEEKVELKVLRGRACFARQRGKVSGVVLKMPWATFEASKL